MMTYKGIVKGKIIELAEPLPYEEGQAVSVSVEALHPELRPGTAAAILRVMRGLPDLNPHDVDELEQVIRRGRLPVRTEGAFERDEGKNGR
jgi:hypothetical protein